MDGIDKLIEANQKTSDLYSRAYAKSVAIGFMDWAISRQVSEGLGILCDNEGTYDSVEQYFNLYMEESIAKTNEEIKKVTNNG